jgi:hypothetical protein
MTSIPDELRALATSLDGFEKRPYDRHVDYCHVTIYGRGRVLLTFGEHCENEAERFREHVAHHAIRAGYALSQSFAAGTFDGDAAFADLRLAWQRYVRETERCGTTRPLGNFFTHSAIAFFCLQESNELFGTSFPIPPWRPFSDTDISPSDWPKESARWLGDSISEVAKLVERMSETNLRARIAEDPLMLLLQIVREKFGVIIDAKLSESKSKDLVNQ